MSNDLTAARRRLMERRVRAQGLTARSATAQASDSELTAAQRRMWFGQRRNPTGSELNIPFAYRLTGELDVDGLLAALHAVAEQHPALRTVYADDPAGPRRMVRTARVQWHTTDLTELGAAERERRVSVLARRDLDVPFDLARDAPIRAHLIRTGAREHVLALVVHHIAFDDASFALFADALATAYAGGALTPVDVPAAAPETGPERIAAAAQLLRPLPEAVSLPGDTGVDQGAATERTAIGSDLLAAVADAAKTAGVTPFTWLLSAHAVLVDRLFGAEDAAVSIPVTARPAGTEAAIGYFGNISVRRLTVRADESFSALATRLHTEGTASLALADVPIDAVVGTLDPTRNGRGDGFDRLVQLSFSTRAAFRPPQLDGIDAEALELATPAAQVPFEVSVIRSADATSAQVEVRYRRGRVDPVAVRAYLDALPVLLTATVADPATGVRRLPLVSDDRSRELIAAGRGIEVPTDYPRTLVELWDDAVARDPSATAVVTDELSLTYADVDRHTRTLAATLAARGVRAGDVVALELAGSADFPAAALAVMRLGAAYLPVDPTYPPERRRHLIDDAQPRLVLTADDIRTALDDPLDGPAATGSSDTRPCSPDDPAYLIYTSGSTGKPAGVLVTQAAIAEHLAGHRAIGSMTPDDRVLLTSSVSFDASIFEIFTTLTAGATLVIGKPGGTVDFAYVSDLVDRHRVSVVHMVPSTLATHLLLPGLRRWRGVRWIPVGGEALPGDVADRARALLGARLTNNYGPTEAVVAATGRPVDEPLAGTTVPIGGPTPGTVLYVLDRALHPVPDGIAGELYIGGEQLARGYLRAPGRTASRFVADPWRHGRRMYRTGDRVRRRPDGDLEFLGRTDDQVKIHGFRIEPGEIAAVLSGLDSVGQAAVIPVDDPTTGRYLAAYLSPADVDVEAVARAAERELPAHMVPAAYVALDTLPIGPNGKLARGSLPAPNRGVTAGRPPATATERAVAAAFATILDRPLEQISATDSFFRLGGHSLLITRLLALLRAGSGVEIGVRTVFDGPTVAQIAQAVESGGDGQRRLPPLTRRAELPQLLPLTASARSIWFAAGMARGAGVEGTGAGAVEAAAALVGTVDQQTLQSALADVVRKRDALRTVVDTGDGDPRARIDPDWTPQLQVQCLDDGAPEALAAARTAFVNLPFQLGGAPLLRAQLIRTPTAHLLQVVVHHLVTDHRSMQILLDDLFRAYRACRAGAAPDDHEPAPRFADFALWQAEVFGSDAGRAAIDAAAARVRDLPTQIPARHDHRRRPELTFGVGHRADFRIDPALRAQLREVARSRGATEFVLAEAALAVVLHRHAGGRDIAIGTPASGRTEPAVDDMVGVLANMVVLRTGVQPEATLADVLDRARAAAASAFEAQQVPFEAVVDAAAPERRPGLNPLFQTVLHVRDDAAMLAARTVDEGLSASILPMEFDLALVDLSVSLSGTADGGFDGAVIAGPAVYAAATAPVLADALRQVLEAFIHPETRVDEVLPAFEVLTEPLAVDAAQAQTPGATSELSAEQAFDLIASILEELLAISGVRPDDNYFAIGGDSVTSLQFAARACAVGIPLTPQQVFETATLGELVALVTEETPADGPAPAAAPAEAMSTSGLDPQQLAALTSAWKAR